MEPKSVFDIRYAVCAAVVAEEASFTRAAKRLGMSQPSVSERVRKLEDQLGFHVFSRTSRQVQTTELGRGFLVHAQELLRVNTSAQAFAKAVRNGASTSLRIGAPVSTAEIKSRQQLFDQFFRRYPAIHLEIVHAINSELREKLENGEIDIALLQGPFDQVGLERLLLHRAIGHLLVPREHPAAASATLTLAALDGSTVVLPPGRFNPRFFDELRRLFNGAGAAVLEAPEPHHQSMDQFARARRLCLLRFGSPSKRKEPIGDMVRMAFETPVTALDVNLVRLRTNSSPAADRFWRLASAELKKAR